MNLGDVSAFRMGGRVVTDDRKVGDGQAREWNGLTEVKKKKSCHFKQEGISAVLDTPKKSMLAYDRRIS